MRILLILFAAMPSPAQRALVPVPGPNAVVIQFVGCESDGQVGPRNKPTGKSVAAPIGVPAAAALSYYKASESALGVLAPRNWQCFGTYGSSGNSLYVSPEPFDRKKMFSGDLILRGPAIQLSYTFGDTSGRYEVAMTMAHVFPFYRAFVARVSEMFPKEKFSFGPYPRDLLLYKSKKLVEYRTPAGTKGLGTSSLLGTDATPIDGVAILTGETPDLVLLSVRLNLEVRKWTSTIVRHVEREAAKLHD